MAPPPVSTPAPCPHLSSYRSSSRNPFRHLRRSLRVRPLGLPCIRLDPLSHPHCPLCPSSSSSSPSSPLNSSSSRLLACLSCGQVFCPSHASSHPISSPGHYISVDLLRAELFCCSCSDQVYDSDFDSTVSVAQSPSFPSSSSSSPPSSKRRRVDFKQWDPNPSQSQLIRTRSTQLHPDPSSSDLHPWGLRGLNNMGNTCFMNSVLQALLHTPPLRNYFLSDRHNRFLCARRSRKKSANGVDMCLVCDLDQIYSAAFSGDRSPFSPAKFLYSWWRLSSDLASYEQQDAHEFFISILDRIHDNLVEDQQISNHNGQGDCCIAHRVFSGILRSDVTCTHCGFTSTTYDPCIDLSLDLDSTHMSRQAARNGEKETKQKHNQNQSGLTTLMRCLEKFTRPERLDNEQKFYCQKCKERRESLKQMSIRKLPLVLCFHVKRFEHSTIKKTLRKIDSCLQFPFALDMAAYLSSSVLRSRYGNRLLPVVENGASEAVISSGTSSEFEIFAVVTHSGRLDAGHYVTYLRINNSWFKCDDAWVIKVEESIVRESQAYMLFYVQKVLCYTAGGNTGTIEPI